MPVQNLLVARPVAVVTGGNKLFPGAAAPQRPVVQGPPPGMQGGPPPGVPGGPPPGMAPQGIPPQAMPPQGAPPQAVPAQGQPPQPMLPPASRQAAYGQRVQGMQLSPQQAQMHAQAGDVLISELAKLVRGKKEPTMKDVVKGVGEVISAAPAAFPPQVAMKFLNAVPDDPDKIKPFLAARLQDAIASRVHIAGMMAQGGQMPPGAPPGAGMPPGAAPPPQAVPPQGPPPAAGAPQ